MIPCLPARLLAACLLLAVGLAPAARADEARPTTLRPEAVELLPFDSLTRQDFMREHGGLLYRARKVRQDRAGLVKRREALRAKPGRRTEAERKQLTVLDKQIATLGTQLGTLMERVTAEVRADGVEGALIAYMNHAPTGAARSQRYAMGLVLLLDDLTPNQRWLFERVLTKIEGAYAVLEAQQDRTRLALEQSGLEPPARQGILGTFNRQRALIEKRYWTLVDTTLDRDQKVWIWKRLPHDVRRKSQPVEHLYTLAGLEPSQAARLRSLATEIEHESSPDQAAARRATVALAAKDKPLDAEARKALLKERGEAYERLSALQRFHRDAVKEVLTEDQWLEYVAIPPRLSTNDRGGNVRRDLSGWKPSPAQQKQIDARKRELQAAARAAQRAIAEARKEGADYGPDSPQMMEMEMAMTGARAAQAGAGRDLLGAIFLEIMTAEEVGRWVLGHWGYKN